jgi:hypothetical protein
VLGTQSVQEMTEDIKGKLRLIFFYKKEGTKEQYIYIECNTYKGSDVCNKCKIKYKCHTSRDSTLDVTEEDLGIDILENINNWFKI